MNASVQDIPEQRQKLSLWTRMILTITDVAMRRLYPCSVSGLEHYTGTPATLAVSNHRRDNDGPLLASVLLRRQNGLIVAPLPYFAAREDLFEKGFLAHYLRRCPASLRPLLKAINLSPCLVGAYPLQRTHERSVAKALQDVIAYLGDMPVTDVLRPQSLIDLTAELMFDPRSVTITQLLRDYEHMLWRKRYGYRHLQVAVFGRIKPHLRDLIDRQMDHFTKLLEGGQVLILEPEGRLSLDGALRRPRAALHELIKRPNRPVRVLPISVTYDTLTTGYPRIFIDIQPELIGLERLSRRVLDDRVTASIWSGCRVTGSQLVAGFLLSHLSPGDVWSEKAIIKHVYAAAQRCQEAEIPLDPCLRNQQTCELRTRDILAWGCRTRFLTSEGNGQMRVTTPAAPPPWLPDGPSTLLGYLRTELLETMGSVRARDLDLLLSTDMRRTRFLSTQADALDGVSAREIG
jgi:1-acyl-sn-glycerol-3-phosphate acyltransferase